MNDFLHLEQQYTTEEKLIRDNVARFVAETALPLMSEAYEKAYFPTELVPHLARLGLFGMTLPTEYGGSATSHVSHGLACLELEKGDSSLRSFLSVQSALCMYPICTYGSEAQKTEYLSKMAQGKVIGCFGLTEPNHGSDPANMTTHAKKTKTGWLINGTKMWITNAPLADIAIIWAKTEEGIRGFLVPTQAKGVKIQKITHKLSSRTSITGEITLQDCHVTQTALLPGTQIGLAAALACLDKARYGIAWGAVGAALACYESALNYSKERYVFDRPLAQNQLVQKDLVDMFKEILKAQCLNLQVGRLYDQGQVTPAMISLAKMNACYESLKIARTARNLLGANGITLKYPVMRHMTNLESVFTYEGTDNIHHLILGHALTGLKAF